MAQHQGERARGHAHPGQARRGARRRRPPVHRQPAHRAPGGRVRTGRAARGSRAAVHGARLPVRRGDRLPGRAGSWRRRGPGRALGHPRHRDVGVRPAVARPALPQHRLGPAGQLHQRPHRLPAAGRAPRLARRRADLRPHRLLQPRRRRLLRQVARRRGRRPASLGRLARHRAPAELSRGGSAGLGRRGRDRPVDGVEDVRRPGRARAALRRHDGVDGLPRARQLRLPADQGPRAQLQRLARTGQRRHAPRAARHRVLGLRRRPDGRACRGDRAGRGGRALPRTAGEDRRGVRRRVRRRRRPGRLGHADRVRPRPAHGAHARRPAGGRGRAPRRGDRRRRLAPDHRVRRRRLPAAGAQRGRRTPTSPTGCSRSGRSLPGGT